MMLWGVSTILAIGDFEYFVWIVNIPHLTWYSANRVIYAARIARMVFVTIQMARSLFGDEWNFS